LAGDPELEAFGLIVIAIAIDGCSVDPRVR